MQVESASQSLDAETVAAYLRNRVSGSVVYLLTLQQPLTLKEMEGHPLRLRYLEILTGQEAHPARLRKVVTRGVEAGLLVPLATRREYHYFLNSDLGLRLPALGTNPALPRLDWSPGTRQTENDLAVPAASALGRGHPVPLLRDPTAFLGWLEWLSDPRKRAALQALQDPGPLTRKELTERGAEVDLPAVRAALRTGVLRLREGRLDFPFARLALREDGSTWTARPPRVWLTPTYEPLWCVQDAEPYLEAADEKSPVALLREMAEDGRKVIPSWRRSHLTTNLLYEPSAVLPPIEEIGPATLPTVWENRRGWVYPTEGGHERASAAAVLEAELQGDQPASPELAPDALARLARRKVEAYFRERERDLIRRFQEVRRRDYGLGPDAILSLASEELERGRLQEERNHFEAFLELLER